MSTIIFQIQSVLILSVMFWGIWQVKKAPKNLLKHQLLMKTAILWDLILIAQIELSRSAVAQAMNPIKNTWQLNFHITLAISTVLCYPVMWLTGSALLKRDFQFRKIHKILGVTTIFLRLSTFLTSFFAN